MIPFAEVALMGLYAMGVPNAKEMKMTKTNDANADLQKAVKALLEAKDNDMETKAEWEALRSAYAAATIGMSGEMVEPSDLLDTLKITKVERRTSAGGAWVRGTIGGHRFDALVFPEHATVPDYELDDSRISKLSLQRIHDQQMVANFDRGWDTRPTTPIAEQIVDLLAAGLADHIYSE